jgi:hypothetical protein
MALNHSVARITPPVTIPTMQPLTNWRPLLPETLDAVASILSSVSQSMDPAAHSVTLYDERDGREQANCRFAARAALRWCFPMVRHEAELRARADVAEMLYGQPFYRLTSDQQRQVVHVAGVATRAFVAHMEGITRDMLPSERAEMSVPGERFGR